MLQGPSSRPRRRIPFKLEGTARKRLAMVLTTSSLLQGFLACAPDSADLAAPRTHGAGEGAGASGGSGGSLGGGSGSGTVAGTGNGAVGGSGGGTVGGIGNGGVGGSGSGTVGGTGNGAGGTAGGTAGGWSGDGGAPDDGTPDPGTVGDCSGVYDPDRLHEYEFRLAPADWSALVADTTNSVYFPAEMRCGDGAFASVGMRRKRSGGTQKVGFKVDINWQVQGQSFFGLKKLSFENGISEGSGEVGAHALMSEYLGWRLMALSGAITGHAALSRVKVNDTDLGVYVNVEQVDKRFLSSRIGDDSGWLYKKSGSADDGYKTNEDMPNPYEDYFCFWKKSGCAMPTASELASSLPEHLDIQQMLRVAAVNALMANTDTLLQKDNNYIFYDRAAGPRLYFPWDLDTSMQDDLDVFTGTVPGGVSFYQDALFSNWEQDYDQILTELVSGPLSLSVISGELDRLSTVAGNAFDTDPWLTSGSGDAEDLRDWWTARHPAVVASVEAH